MFYKTFYLKLVIDLIGLQITFISIKDLFWILYHLFVVFLLLFFPSILLMSETFNLYNVQIK